MSALAIASGLLTMFQPSPAYSADGLPFPPDVVYTTDIYHHSPSPLEAAHVRHRNREALPQRAEPGGSATAAVPIRWRPGPGPPSRERCHSRTDPESCELVRGAWAGWGWVVWGG